MPEMKPTIYIPYEYLPDAKDWKVGKVYRIKMVIKQTSQDENSAGFEIVDATSMETDRKSKRVISSDSGSYVGD